ncbi:MAG: ATP-binding protein [Bacillota bacterium]|nr:ATP-binding protein [Bacillota bacterium]
MSDPKPVNSSIVYKLNTWHLFQVFLGFFWLNLILLVLFTGLVWLRAERVVSEAAVSMPTDEYVLEDSPDGFWLPGFIDFIFADHMENAFRQIVTEDNSEAFWQRVEGLRYRVWVEVPEGNSYYAVDYSIGSQLVIFLPIGIVLLLYELLFLLGSIGKGARATRKALQPIADLALTTKTIHTAQTAQPDAQLRDLKGTIDNIDVTELGTRISISSDQRELKDLAEAINAMLERVNNAYRSQVRFVSDASHELRTPIAVIQGYVNLLDRWGKNDEKALHESITAIKGEAENMKELVEQLLFLARGDNDSMQLAMQEINLTELIAEVLRETEMIDSQHQFLMKAECDVITTGDVQLIKQAIRIFVDNSVKYTPPGGMISVNTVCEEDAAKVIIQDEGIGITPEDIPYVFDRFYRSDDSRARKTGGTGLGLAIARWIIERHKGNIEILSRKDIGTRVTISLLYSQQK